MDEYLQRLVAMQTVSSDKDANNAGLDYLESFFHEKGLFTERLSSGGYGSLFATTKPHTKTPKVLLAVHLDVVPSTDLFALSEKNGTYIGRGVFDMKFAAASYMHVVDQLQDRLDDFDFGVLVTTDEEMGGLNGVLPFIEAGYKPEVVILPDGAADWNIETFAKGVMWFDITASGKTAHSSMPWEGESANEKLLDILAHLRQQFREQSLNTNTLNISIIHGGKAKNQVSDKATASLDIRYMTPADRTRIVANLELLCQKYNATLQEVRLEGHPCVNDLSHPLIAPFVESVAHITGVQSNSVVSYGASDARFFAGINVPCIICRPPGGGQHAETEWIDKQGFEQYHLVLVDYLEKIAKS